MALYELRVGDPGRPDPSGAVMETIWVLALVCYFLRGVLAEWRRAR